MNRIRAGYCRVPNPFNKNQVSRVSLDPNDVHVIVFWTRNPRPLMPYLDELTGREFRYYFQYTVMDNPDWLDPKSPPVAAAIKTFQELSKKIGREKVIWRYDPMVFTPHTHAGFHLQTFARIADALHRCTDRVVISIMDEYPKAARRLRKASDQGGDIFRIKNPFPEWFNDLITDMVEICQRYNMEIVSCAEHLDLSPLGVRPGKCVDDDYIESVFEKIKVTDKKDPSQRKECGCVVSKDIGTYDTCLFGCQYCYATRSFDMARKNHQEHDPNSELLTGHLEHTESLEEEPPDKESPQQTDFFGLFDHS